MEIKINLTQQIEEIEDEIDGSYKGKDITFEDVYNSPEWVVVQRIKQNIRNFVKLLKEDIDLIEIKEDHFKLVENINIILRNELKNLIDLRIGELSK